MGEQAPSSQEMRDGGANPVSRPYSVGVPTTHQQIGKPRKVANPTCFKILSAGSSARLRMGEGLGNRKEVSTAQVGVNFFKENAGNENSVRRSRKVTLLCSLAPSSSYSNNTQQTKKKKKKV